MWWSGLGVTDVKAALSAVGAVTVDVCGRPGVALADDLDVEPAVAQWIVLLPSLDPTPMGWKAREWYLGEHGPRVFDRSGNIGPTVWSDGRIVGGWPVRAGTTKGTSAVVFELFDDVGAEATAAITQRAAELEV